MDKFDLEWHCENCKTNLDCGIGELAVFDGSRKCPECGNTMTVRVKR